MQTVLQRASVRFPLNPLPHFLQRSLWIAFKADVQLLGSLCVVTMTFDQFSFQGQLKIFQTNLMTFIRLKFNFHSM